MLRKLTNVESCWQTVLRPLPTVFYRSKLFCEKKAPKKCKNQFNKLKRAQKEKKKARNRDEKMMTVERSVFFFFNFYFQLQGTYLQYLLTNNV